MKNSGQISELINIIQRQIQSFWPTDFENIQLEKYVGKALEKCIESFEKSNNKYFEKNGFSPLNTVQYSIFLYYLSHELGQADDSKERLLADKIYYLNKIMNSVDWFWGIELPEHFIAEHPVGTVLGRADYGEYLCVYQGCTIGGSIKNGELHYPRLSDYVILYSNVSILGDCAIGNHVIFAANTCVINEDIPANSIVFGSSPNLVIKPLTEEKRAALIGHIWKE